MVQRSSPREALAFMLEAGARYLDVRTPEEFAGGHPEGAVNVPLKLMSGAGMRDNDAFVSEVRALFAPDQALVIGCKSGVRSLAAATLLEAEGFTNLREQRAGTDGVADPFGRVREKGWRAEGLPWSV